MNKARTFKKVQDLRAHFRACVPARFNEIRYDVVANMIVNDEIAIRRRRKKLSINRIFIPEMPFCRLENTNITVWAHLYEITCETEQGVLSLQSFYFLKCTISKD